MEIREGVKIYEYVQLHWCSEIHRAFVVDVIPFDGDSVHDLCTGSNSHFYAAMLNVYTTYNIKTYMAH